jgi:hypothetical protein
VKPQKKVERWKSIATDGLAKHRYAKQRRREERKKLRAVKTKLKHVVTAQGIVQEVAQAVQREAHKRIAKVVSKCLEAVFNHEYRFRILFERKRGKTEARLVFRKGRHTINPKESGAGGVIDVAAFALRIACMIWSRPRLRRFLVLDEPFRFVHASRLPMIEQLILRLAKELHIQFFIVTHLPLHIGKTVTIT